MNITSKVKSLSMICMVLMATGAVAQEADAVKDAAPAEGHSRRMPPPRREMDRMNPSGPIFARMLSRPEFVSQLGLPEETAKKIGAELEKISEEEKALFQERGRLSKAQADALAALMADRSKTGDDAMKVIADIEAVSSKISALNIKRMLVIRDNLTDEQISQASELVKKRFASRRDEMMRERRGDMRGPGAQRRPGEPGARRMPPKRGPGEDAKGEDAPPPPPPAGEDAPPQEM